MSLRVLFIGLPDMGTICLRALTKAGINVVGILAAPKDNSAYGMFLEEAKGYNLPILFYDTLKDEQLLKSIKELHPDIAVVCSFSKKIPKEMLDIVPMGFINCHPSLLPDYRGGNPYFHIINNGEKFSGVTLHFMDESFDTGDIVAQQKFAVEKFETMGTLFNKTNFMIADMLVKVLKDIESGNPPKKYPQPKEGDFKKAPMIDFEHGANRIDWDKTAEEIDRFVRACNPFWGAYCFFRGCFIKVYAASFEKKKHNFPPGTVVKVKSDYIAIAAREGLFFPKVLHVGSYFCSDVRDFIKFSAPLAGEQFE